MKKSSAVNISVPKPCGENWNNMTPEAQGRHCQSCAKVVTDYTIMSDARLIQHLTDNKGGCGRFRSDQLSRTLAQPMPTQIWAFPRFMVNSVTAIATALASSFAVFEAHGQESISQNEILLGDIVMGAHPEMRQISGLVVSDDGALSRAAVFIPALSMEKHYVDENGYFNMEIPWDTDLRNLKLIVERDGYASQAIDLNRGTVGLHIAMLPQRCEPIVEPELMGIPVIEMGKMEIHTTGEPRIEPGQEKVFEKQ